MLQLEGPLSHGGSHRSGMPDSPLLAPLEAAANFITISV